MRVHIVTDSHAHFAHPQSVLQFPVTVVHNTIHIGGNTYRDGVELGSEAAIELISHQPTPPLVEPPTVEDYVNIYTQIALTHDGIISLHASRHLSESWVNARAAAEQLRGHLQIAVIDTGTLDAAQGMVVRAAAKVIDELDDFDAIVRGVRGATERVYSVYFVETMDYLLRNELMPPSHAILATMHETMPLLTVEDGLLLTMEKVRTRSQAIERLVDFAVEFVDLEDALILHHRSLVTEQTRSLQNRLSSEFEDRYFQHTVYSPSLAALIGADAMGLVLLESAPDALR